MLPHPVLLLGVDINQYLSAYCVPRTILGSVFWGSWFGNISEGHRRMKTPSPLGLLGHPQTSIEHKAYAY